MNTIGAKKDKDLLTLGQRWGELITVLVMLLLLGFFIDHQTAQTGFYTANFGAGEMVCLYGPILCSFAAPLVRAVTGQRNPARPFEAATNLFLAIGAFWLLIVFPFNFAYLADALPGSLHFVLAWVTNDMGKIVLILQIVIGLIIALVTLSIYLFRRRRASSPPLSPQPS
jgi:hypothetical protein